MTKQELRQKILKARDSVTGEDRKAKEKSITNHVIASKEFREAENYLLFYSFRNEVETTNIINKALSTGKPVYLPKVQGKEMEFYRIASVDELYEGYQGILEPKADTSTKFIPDVSRKLFVLIPGVVFDKNGGRIGYGAGYYDKFLNTMEKQVQKENLCKMAIAFSCQIVEEGYIKREAHDISPTHLVTEKACYLL